MILALISNILALWSLLRTLESHDIFGLTVVHRSDGNGSVELLLRTKTRGLIVVRSTFSSFSMG